MKMATNIKNVLLYSICVLTLVVSGFINKSYDVPAISISKQNAAVNVDSNILLFFSSGQRRLLADLFWITTLLESDIEHYKKVDLNSWLYLRFKTIISLDPKFLHVYNFGGKYLSIIKDDLSGAKDIFERGLLVFPNNYELLFNAAYLYAFEIQDYTMALKQYKRLLHFPQAPEYIKTLVSKIEFEVTQDIESTFTVLLDIYKSEQEGTFLKTRLESDLYAIKAQIDLKCLNQKKVGCSSRDFRLQQYILRNGSFFSRDKFKEYKLHKRKK
jgi:tetratricopeptide (TPR) repeat protein